MFKKYLSIPLFVLVFSFIFVNHSNAFTLTQNNCNATSTSETVTVVSQADMSGVIPLCVIAYANFPINVFYNSFSGNPFYSVSTSGQTLFNYPQTGQTTLANLNQDNGYTFYVSDSASQTSEAQIKIKPAPAPITLTNNKGLTNGGSYTLAEIGNGSSASPYAPSNVNIVSHGVVGEVWLDWTNNVNATTCFIYYGTDYGAAVAFSNSAHPGGCTNRSITGLSAGTYYFKVGNYYNNIYNYSDIYKVVIDSSGYFSSSVSMTNNLRFTCTNTSEFYYDTQYPNPPTVSDYTGANGYNLIYTPSLTLGTHTVECDNIGGSATRKDFTYTITDGTLSGDISASPNPCYITAGNNSCKTTLTWSTLNPVGTSAVTSDTDGTGASSIGNVIGNGNNNSVSNINIPYTVLGSHQGRNFYLYNNAVLLDQVNVIAECTSGTNWNGSECVAQTTTCPPGTPSGANGYPSCVCPTNTYDINGTCGTCTAPSLYDQTTKSCVPPLTPPNTSTYSHFVSFNVSAAYVKKGNTINLNWKIQDPNSTCKIIGKSVKTGNELFNSTNQSLINDKLTAVYGGVANYSIGDYKSIIGSFYTMDESTRFIASCTDTTKGYLQLVRDVYVTNEGQR